MGQNAKPWTTAIDAYLKDGEWHDIEDVLQVGAEQVSVERALQEMGSKQSTQTEERRIAIGRRNVAMQAVTGRVRFGHFEYGDGKKKIRSLGQNARSLGELALRVDDLTAKLDRALDQIDSMQSQLDRLDAESEGRAAEQSLLVAAGATGVSQP